MSNGKTLGLWMNAEDYAIWAKLDDQTKQDIKNRLIGELRFYGAETEKEKTETSPLDELLAEETKPVTPQSKSEPIPQSKPQEMPEKKNVIEIQDSNEPEDLMDFFKTPEVPNTEVQKNLPEPDPESKTSEKEKPGSPSEVILNPKEPPQSQEILTTPRSKPELKDIKVRHGPKSSMGLLLEPYTIDIEEASMKDTLTAMGLGALLILGSIGLLASQNQPKQGPT